MMITVLRTSLPKQTPTIIRYMDYEHFSLARFCNDLFTKLNNNNNMKENGRNYERFESNFVELTDMPQ